MTTMAIGKHRRAVGVFPNRQQAEQALSELRDRGFPMDRVSIVAKDANRRDEIAGTEVKERVGNKADDGAKTGVVAGGALGGLTGLLVGLGALAIPGIGPIMLAGAGATALATALSGGAIGAAAGGLLGALAGLGIPEERAKAYQHRISQGDYLVMVEGTEAELRQAESILSHHGVQDWGVYDLPESASSTVSPTPVTETAPSAYVEADAQTVRLYEERLVVDKDQVKTGEVRIDKHVEAKTERISVPVDKERVVVERIIPVDAGQAVAPGEATFGEAETARIEVYEETVEIKKQAFVREEVNLRKEVDVEMVEAQEQVRREELDVDAQGRNIIDKTHTP